MKLISFVAGSRSSYGVIHGDGVIDLGARLVSQYPDLKSLLANEGLSTARALLQQTTADIALEGLQFLPVIPNPAKIFCIGLNYEEHRVEAQREKTPHPTVFMRYPESQVGHLQPMLRPRESHMFDYEGELAVVIGKPGRRILEAEAWTHIAGYSCYNEGSVRDWQNHTSQFGPGKNFVHTGAFGPWLVTADEIAPAETLSILTRLNGQLMQSSDTSKMIFAIPRLIAYCSTFLPLGAGDVIVTGTPGGVGVKRSPPLFMKDGDVVEIEIGKVGVLRNTIACG
jgi:2-keto-4-pentenoate hydratase/2-oxohepta-3-ene-1,7-dioic acid hydratase in catechol pathway